jgi:polynucleotide 5'-hydroxyl-kinase GRC3/NOL9
MKRTVEKGKTLLVDGPASVSLIAGKVEVFGSVVKNGRRIVIREGKRLPFAVEEKADFDISTGESASVSEADGDTTPQSWVEAFETLRGLGEKPVVAMVLGGIDSGKSSFCTYLTNKLVGDKKRAAILDGDLGQSDIGPPCTVGYAFATKPVTDLFELKEENAYFVGVTSPSEAVAETIKGTALMKAEILSKNPDYVVANTDGWVEGEAAVRYKALLAEELGPVVIFYLQQENELAPLLDALGNFRKTQVAVPPAVSQRNPVKRRNLREMGYAKYLSGGKTRTFPFRLMPTAELRAASVGRNEMEGLLVGLHNSRRLVGIGVLRGVDRARENLKVFTNISTMPSCIVLGKTRLDKNLKEVPPISS